MVCGVIAYRLDRGIWVVWAYVLLQQRLSQIRLGTAASDHMDQCCLHFLVGSLDTSDLSAGDSVGYLHWVVLVALAHVPLRPGLVL